MIYFVYIRLPGSKFDIQAGGSKLWYKRWSQTFDIIRWRSVRKEVTCAAAPVYLDNTGRTNEELNSLYTVTDAVAACGCSGPGACPGGGGFVSPVGPANTHPKPLLDINRVVMYHVQPQLWASVHSHSVRSVDFTDGLRWERGGTSELMKGTRARATATRRIWPRRKTNLLRYALMV